MVYCNFIKATNEKIIYNIGGSVNDITGELVIRPSDGLPFEITKQPENSAVSPIHIEFMIERHIQELKKKNYPKKMAYEI